MRKNRISEVLGIRYPIIQAPMNWVSGADLVAAVSNAGGLGTLGPNAGSKDKTTDVELTGERIRAQIRSIRQQTSAPFGVNIVAGFGELLVYSQKVVDAVNIPVVTGGGIGDARGILAALALGADGIYMGTRFMVTQEAASHKRVKAHIVKGQGVCTVSVPKDFILARDLANQFTEKYLQMHQQGAGREALAAYLEAHSQYHSQYLGEADEAEVCCGQVAGLIEEIQPTAELMDQLVHDIKDRFQALQTVLDTSF